MNELYKLSATEHEKILKKIMDEEFKSAKRFDCPKAFIIGGQPGSGKSTFINKLINSGEAEQSIVIDVDKYRLYHPKINEIYSKYPDDVASITNQDARYWTQHIFATAIENRNNIIFEGIMRSNQICHTIKRMYDQGYEVNIYIMATNFYESKLDVYSRFAQAIQSGEIPRYTHPEVHDKSYAKMLLTLQQIENDGCFHNISVHTRDKEIYSASILQKDKTDIVKIVSDFREKLWSKSRFRLFEKKADNLVKSFKQLNEIRYISQLTDLKREAKCMMQ